MVIFFLLVLSQNFHCYILYLLLVVLPLHTCREGLVPSSLHPCLAALRSFFRLLNKFSFLIFSSRVQFYSTVFLELSTTELDMMFHMWSKNCSIAEKNHFPQPVGCSQVSGWPLVHTADPCWQTGFLANQLEPWNCCLGLFNSRRKILHLPLLNFMTFQSALSFSFLRSL